jgi:hypothetical protein
LVQNQKTPSFVFAVIPCIPLIPVKIPLRCKSLSYRDGGDEEDKTLKSTTLKRLYWSKIKNPHI